ncbi:hypothetical protein B0H34DRAFT_803533 [Crassisporium funariophilum]|nr:hypothetical protein B0H34DRAFT_803533 [Crassisporium funariophilum]
MRSYFPPKVAAIQISILRVLARKHPQVPTPTDNVKELNHAPCSSLLSVFTSLKNRNPAQGRGDSIIYSSFAFFLLVFARIRGSQLRLTPIIVGLHSARGKALYTLCGWTVTVRESKRAGGSSLDLITDNVKQPVVRTSSERVLLDDKHVMFVHLLNPVSSHDIPLHSRLSNAVLCSQVGSRLDLQIIVLLFVTRWATNWLRNTLDLGARFDLHRPSPDGGMHYLRFMIEARARIVTLNRTAPFSLIITLRILNSHVASVRSRFEAFWVTKERLASSRPAVELHTKFPRLAKYEAMPLDFELHGYWRRGDLGALVGIFVRVLPEEHTSERSTSMEGLGASLGDGLSRWTSAVNKPIGLFLLCRWLYWALIGVVIRQASRNSKDVLSRHGVGQFMTNQIQLLG